MINLQKGVINTNNNDEEVEKLLEDYLNPLTPDEEIEKLIDEDPDDEDLEDLDDDDFQIRIAE
jgi:SRSO17 transposase